MTATAMLPDLQSSLICDDVRQERNGKFILIGIFDAIAVPQYPAMFQRLCMVNRWCCGDGEFTQQSRLLKPDGITVVTEGQPIAVKLTDSTATATCVEIFMNIKFENPGIYWTEVLLDGKLRLRYPLRAGLVPATPPRPSAPQA
jgi:hypothetical protein